ncbi:uncharacterized protein EV422DRAFT_260873 [Fimicolochytrium jonesii]|uniref:uncharacterized protein n=1 Tax=Fimicolochytrium jonesii TaxID=1396493 RepID=UPI0022FE5FD9|nr:uncharacterized protein EV422DRAFT_260873 [Fimicolochytrium jonesii]KAI8817016.1 hypothetical protein EV422DRAFT_260873 [Fimicolochytrium jonesii]
MNELDRLLKELDKAGSSRGSVVPKSVSGLGPAQPPPPPSQQPGQHQQFQQPSQHNPATAGSALGSSGRGGSSTNLAAPTQSNSELNGLLKDLTDLKGLVVSGQNASSDEDDTRHHPPPRASVGAPGSGRSSVGGSGGPGGIRNANLDFGALGSSGGGPGSSGGSARSSNTVRPAVTPKPCATCAKPVIGPTVNAMGRTYHPEHFTCRGCDRQLGQGRFYEKDGFAFCEGCWQKDLPSCAYCSGVVMERCVEALGRSWHPHHFFCAQCGKLFPPGAAFLEKDGMAYCEDDYFALFATRCGGCEKVIFGEFVSACGKEWHMDCFVCGDCKQPFPTGTFYEHQGRPYCATHHSIRRTQNMTSFDGSGSQQRVQGRLDTHSPQKGAQQQNQPNSGSALGSGSDSDPSPSATANLDLPSLPGPSISHALPPSTPFCSGCQKHVASRGGGTAEVVSIAGKVWHMECFTCSYCGKKLNPKAAGGGAAGDGKAGVSGGGGEGAPWREREGRCYCYGCFNYVG